MNVTNKYKYKELPKTIKEQISKFEESYSDSKENPAFLANLGDLYKKAYELSNNKIFRKKALNAYQEFSKLAPNHFQVFAVIYNLKAESAVDGDIDFSSLKSYYAAHPQLKNTTIPGPSFYQSYALIKERSSDKNRILKLLKQSLKENPKALGPYSLLILQHLDNKRFLLAEAILKQAKKKFPDSNRLRGLQANITYDKINAQDCVISDKNLLKKGIVNFKELLKDNPNNLDARLSLARLYRALGLYQLSLAEYNRAIELDDGLSAKAGKVQALIFLDRMDDATALISEIGKTHPNYRANFADWLSVGGRWDESLKLFVLGFERIKGVIDFYDVQWYAFATLMLNDKETAQKAMEEKLGFIKMNKWESTLSKFFLDKISKEKLLEKATNSCRLTEAFYSIAMFEWQQGNIASALDYFSKIKAEKVFPYVEYAAAKYHIKTIELQK